MADVSRLVQLLRGKPRGLDLTSSTLVLASVKIGAGHTELTQTILDRLVTIQNGGTAGAGYIGIANASSYFASATTVETALDEAKHESKQLVALSGVATLSADLGTFTAGIIPNNQTVKAALQALETYEAASRSLITKFTWLNAVLDIRLDPTGLTPTTGDRYLIAGTGAGAFLGHDNNIAEWNGSAWVFTAPSTGEVVAVDTNLNALYIYGGSSWSAKNFEATTASTGLTKSGFDIQLANAAANSGIVVSSGAISISLASGSGLKFVSNQLAIDFTVAAALSDLASTASGKGASLIGIQDAGSYFTTKNVEAALQQLGADFASLAPASVTETMVAGQSFTANTLYAVRMAKPALTETAGRVVAADYDTTTHDNFHVIGLIYPGTAISAGQNVTVYKLGMMTVGTHGLTIGEEHFLGASGAVVEGGTDGASAPSTALQAVVGVAIARTTTVLEVKPQFYMVN